jgi:CSLREA domain-containing protein
VAERAPSRGSRRRLAVAAIAAIAALAVAAPALANDFVVTTNADTGSGSLRDAITLSNQNEASVDTIRFDLPLAGSTITPATALPAITDPVTIDGSLSGATNGAQAVRLDGALLDSNSGVGLQFQSGSATLSTIRGLTVTRFGSGLVLGTDIVKVVGNFVGTDSGGASGLGNGIGIVASGAQTIGGSTAADRNVVSGNTAGIYLNGSGTVIRGNYVGTAPSGNTAVPNVQGIFANPGSGNTIGGTGAGEGNLISGNSQFGIRLDPGSGTTIYGNRIGTKADGVSALGNGGSGIVDNQNGIANNTIGGTGAGQANIIAFNQFGVFIQGTGRGDTISGNAIFGNTDLGIDLAPGGVTANDPGDADTGPNELQNFPVLATATSSQSGTRITGTVSGSLPSSFITIEFFANASCDDSGNGQGARYLGSYSTQAGEFDTGSSVTGVAAPGEWVTATATDTFGDTSEFSNCVQIPPPADPPQSGPTYTVNTSDDPGDGTCTQNNCTLREALNAANADDVASTIKFAIDGTGTHTITLSSVLPTISSEIHIEGYTQPGSSPNTLSVGDNAVPTIAIYSPDFIGCSCTSAALAVGASGSGSTIRGLVVGGGFDVGILLDGPSNVTVAGNFVGTDTTGTEGSSPQLQTGISVRDPANANTIGGLGAADRNVISGAGSSATGVDIDGSNTIVQGNYIGTDKTGTVAIPNINGVELFTSATGNQVLGNLISGNFGSGVLVDGEGTSGNTVGSNLIGTTADGTGALGNEFAGVSFQFGSHDNTVSGNVLSGNGSAGFGDAYGVYLAGGPVVGNVIKGNKIGTNAAGTAAVPNSSDGIRMSTAGANTVGGTAPSDRNVISGNTGHGIHLMGASGETIVGNYVGLNAAGTTRIANGIDGIAVEASTTGTTIGGAAAGAGNVISGNTNQGISIFTFGEATPLTTGTVIKGNLIGTEATGQVGDGTGNGGEGIGISSSFDTTVGGIAPGESNLIAGNGSNGVGVHTSNGTPAARNTIRANRIRNNGALGIDLSPAGVTANDEGDVDGGPNGLQNFPFLSGAVINGASTQITGQLDTAPGTYTIDYYASPSCDASGNGEGAVWIGYSILSAPNGTVSIDTGAGITGPVSPGDAVTATATDSSGNTSEFSACVTATPGALQGLRLSSDEVAVPTGASNVPLSSVPAATLGRFAGAPIPNSPIPNSPVGQAPIPHSPIPHSPIPHSPIANSPIANSPIANSGFSGIPAQILASVQLSSIPIDWTAILAAMNRVNVPLATLTLADVYASPAAAALFEQVPLGRTQLQDTLLRGVRMTSLLYGSTALAKIPPYTQSAWCALLSSCPAYVNVDTTTVLGLDVAGLLTDAAFTSLGEVTVGQVRDTTSPTAPIPNSPIPHSPIPNSPIPHSALSLTAIGAITLASLASPNAVVDCTRISCTSPTTTLAQADALNPTAVRVTATFQDILRPKPPSLVSPLAGVNWNSFAVGLIGLENLPWESWPIDGFQEFAGTGDVVHYHLDAPVPCGQAYQLRALLPQGFMVKRGTSTLSVNGGAATTVADPATDPVTGATWSLPAIACTGTQPVRLDFQGLAGFRLGELTAKASLITGGVTRSAADQAPVTVTQSFEPGDNAPATAPSIAANTLAVGQIGTQGDVDWRSFSTSGLPAGTIVTVYLRPPTGTDLDVYLTKPSSASLLTSPIPNSPIPHSPIPNSPLPDLGTSLGQTADNPQPEGLQDAPIPNSAIAASGITRGDGVETAQVTLSGDEGGPVNIAVDGYNGAFSADAYTLRVKVTLPKTLPPCPARTFANPAPANPTLPASIPSTTRTLFVMNFGAMVRTYGSTAATNLRTRLTTVAGRSEVAGVVLQVDGDAAVRTAKGAWDAAPCSVAAANDVVRKINAVVARYRAQATGLQNIVIVGGDEIVPMARISDLTGEDGESTAVGDLLFTTSNLTRGNALFASEFLDNTLTDDAYTAGESIPWFGRELYLPQLAGGRLVETPQEIMGQLDQYIASNGVLTPSTAVVTGYDFMKDEAGTISADLQRRTTPALTIDQGPAGTPFIGDQWLKAALLPYFQANGTQRGIISSNGHYNHWELATPTPAPPTTDSLLPTSVLPLLGAPVPQQAGSVLFTMGCHAGLNVSDTFPSGTTPERLRDWAQALSQNKVAVYVANTGYGYGDYDAIVLSERLMTLFAQNLASDGSIGRKLTLAKRQYAASIGSYDPYAEKALAETTFYGLPFYRIGAGPEPPIGTTVPTSPDPSGTGVQVSSFTVSPSLTKHPTDRGTYWSATGVGADGGVEYLKDRPVEPRLTKDMTAATATLRAHGVRITNLVTHDEPGTIDPLIATPLIDQSAHEPEDKVTGVTFPATITSLNHWTAFNTNHDQLVIDAGQTRPDANGNQIQRLVDTVSVQVLYSTSTDVTAPIFTSVGSIVNGSTATLFARTNDESGGSGVVRVMAYFTQGGAQWTFVPLTRVGTTDLYTGTATGITVPRIEAAFWSQDAAGNVGYTTDKGRLFTSLTGDSEPPQVTIAAPIDHGTFAIGQNVPASFSCSDPGGVSTCTGTVANGLPIDTGSVGPKTFTVTATDLSGNTTPAAQASASYTVTASAKSLCLYTYTLVQGSAKYRSLSNVAKAVIDALVKRGCDRLDQIVPNLSPAQKQALINAYNDVVDALVSQGYLTPAQATALKAAAATL